MFVYRYGVMAYPSQSPGYGFLPYPSYHPQSIPTPNSNDYLHEIEDEDVDTEDMEGGNADIEISYLDSMEIASSLDVVETWIDAMNVNNDAPLDDIPEEVDDTDEHIEMEEPLEDDQCNDTIMERSVVQEF